MYFPERLLGFFPFQSISYHHNRIWTKQTLDDISIKKLINRGFHFQSTMSYLKGLLEKNNVINWLRS